MKIKALLIAAMLAPAAYAQAPSVQKYMEPAFDAVYTGVNVRPEKVKPLTDRAAELNKQRAALQEEGNKIDQLRASKDAKVPATPDSSGKVVQPAPMPSVEDYERRVAAWRTEAQAFRRETTEEFRLRREQIGPVVKSLGAWQDAIDDATVSLQPAMTPASAPATKPTSVPPAAPKPAAAPVTPAATGPKPSSVPGFPPGVEPRKKAATPELPPGMSRG